MHVHTQLDQQLLQAIFCSAYCSRLELDKCFSALIGHLPSPHYLLLLLHPNLDLTWLGNIEACMLADQSRQGACAIQLWLVHHSADSLGQDSPLPHHKETGQQLLTPLFNQRQKSNTDGDHQSLPLCSLTQSRALCPAMLNITGNLVQLGLQ